MYEGNTVKPGGFCKYTIIADEDIKQDVCNIKYKIGGVAKETNVIVKDASKNSIQK